LTGGALRKLRQYTRSKAGATLWANMADTIQRVWRFTPVLDAIGDSGAQFCLARVTSDRGCLETCVSSTLIERSVLPPRFALGCCPEPRVPSWSGAARSSHRPPVTLE
jgi:hypothetical protein